MVDVVVVDVVFVVLDVVVVVVFVVVDVVVVVVDVVVHGLPVLVCLEDLLPWHGDEVSLLLLSLLILPQVEDQGDQVDHEPQQEAGSGK